MTTFYDPMDLTTARRVDYPSWQDDPEPAMRLSDCPAHPDHKCPTHDDCWHCISEAVARDATRDYPPLWDVGNVDTEDAPSPACPYCGATSQNLGTHRSGVCGYPDPMPSYPDGTPYHVAGAD